MIQLNSKLSSSDTSIFSKMSKLAREYDAINLGQGFPNFDCEEKLRVLVSKYLNRQKNQYAPMPGVFELRSMLSDKFRSLYGIEVDPNSEITITAGATQAIFTIVSAFIRPDDEVIIFEPAYDSYRPTIELNGGKLISVELAAPEYSIDWTEVSQKITDRTRMIILNNPHNPLGTICDSSDLVQLEKIVKDRNIIVLSDEVYEHLVYDGKSHESILKYPALYKQSMAVFSFGKTFHVTGWKMGYCVGPEKLMYEFRKVHQWNVFSVNSFLQYAIAEYLEDESTYFKLSGFYQAKRDLFCEAMQSSRFKPLTCSGSYFQLCDYSDISDLPDTEFADYLVKEYQVASIPVSVFYGSGKQDRVIRFCFAKTEDQLLKAAEILCKI